MVRFKGLEHSGKLHDVQKKFSIANSFKWLKHDLNTQAIPYYEITLQLRSQATIKASSFVSPQHSQPVYQKRRERINK